METSQDTARSDKHCLSALYYPETICLDVNHLKYLLFIYDKIFFLPVDYQYLNPGCESLSKRFSIIDGILTGAFRTKQDAHYTTMYSSDSEIWDDHMRRLMDLYDELEEKGITVPLQDPEFNYYKAYPLKTAVDADVQSPNFLSICSRYKNKEVHIPEIENAKFKGGGGGMRALEYKGDIGIPSLCSGRINTTLYFAGKDNLYPVCGYEMYINLLKEKLKRAVTNAPTYSLPKNKVHKFSLMSWEIVTEVVPPHIVGSKSSRDIIRYKDECTELKERFWSYLWKLEAMTTAEPWTNEFARELNKLVQTEVIPEAQKLCDKKAEIWEKLFSQSVKAVPAKAALSSLGVYFVNGFSSWEILSLSTAAGIVGAALSPLMDAWEEKQKLNRNALFFLIKYRNRR